MMWLITISIHASREGSDISWNRWIRILSRFQSTLPAREATSFSISASFKVHISIHASREGSDPWPPYNCSQPSYFNPRFPRGKRHTHDKSIRSRIRFQSTLPAREATLCYVHDHLFRPDFNPRFPRGKRPEKIIREVTAVENFNPRFPRGKRRIKRPLKSWPRLFQSTLPAREATEKQAAKAPKKEISIHASREGSDDGVTVLTAKASQISIHASREGSDRAQLGALWALRNFNPRFPRGKRPSGGRICTDFGIFQSTLPAREATYYGSDGVRHRHISIHASREGSDPEEAAPFPLEIISIHASREGSDIRITSFCRLTFYFNPRFPRGKRP